MRLHRRLERGVEELPAGRAAGRLLAVEPFAVGVAAHPEESRAERKVVKLLRLALGGDGVETRERVAVLPGGQVVGRDAELGGDDGEGCGCWVPGTGFDPRDVGVGRAWPGDLSLRQAALKPQAADAVADAF
jgi:hypothetical protein